MRQNQPTPDDARQGGQPAPAVAARTRLATDSALAQARRLEKMGGFTRRERLRLLWYRLRLTVQEMNYASRRVVELQTRLP